MHKKYVVIPTVILVVLVAVWWFKAGGGKCPTVTTTKTVHGSSLAGFIENGQKITVKEGYYECHPVLRDDVVIYRYAGTTPIIKIVKGIAGDSFALQPISSGKYYIVINGQLAQNSDGQPYVIGQDQYEMLSLYVRDFRGAIPRNALLIMGNLPGGSSDSSVFGLVDKGDLIGKVTRIR
jgi:signal peptidase I